MKRKYLITYNNSTLVNYIEDEIDKEQYINDSDDVFNFLRDCYLLSAKHKNDYPLKGEIHYKLIHLWEQYYEICNLGHIHIKTSLPITHLNFYHEGKRKFKEWEKRIKTFIPKIREKAREERIKEKELKELERLKNKYE